MRQLAVSADASDARSGSGSVRAAWSTDVVVFGWRSVRAMLRAPDLLFYALLQPVVFIALFAFVFGGAISPPGTSYRQFLVPGVMVQMVLFGSVAATAIGVAKDVQRGVMDRYRSLPIARSAILIGRQGAEVLRNMLSISVMLAIGLLMGFRIHGTVGSALTALALLLLFGFAFSWIAAFVGVWAGSVEAAQGGAMLWLFPFTFLSSAFVPTATITGWLGRYASHSPVTLMADALRNAFDGQPIGMSGWYALAWSVGIIAVFMPLTLRRFGSRQA